MPPVGAASRQPLRAGAAILLAAMVLAACGTDEAGERDFDPGPTPPEFAVGGKDYGEKCRRCHGEHGLGTSLGPPLVHEYYAPAHHADAAFLRAVMLGVQQHHWTFGPMPAMPELGEARTRLITGYVRWLQRKAGIYTQ